MFTGVMGVLNVTPDSFSDGGRWVNPTTAVARGLQMIREGATIIDVGGESTRPGSGELSSEEERARVLPVVQGLSDAIRDGNYPGVRISIDTRHADVAQAAVGAGASIINDISASLDSVAAQTGAAWVAMHMLGTPETMQDHPRYDDVVQDVLEFLVAAGERAKAAGVKEVYIDPGIGFGKTVEHNCKLLNALPKFRESGFPVLVGASRKRFIAKISTIVSGSPESGGSDIGINDNPEVDRLGGSIASAVIASLGGADIVRVHDVKETVQAIQVARAIAAQTPARNGANMAPQTSAKVTN